MMIKQHRSNTPNRNQTEPNPTRLYGQAETNQTVPNHEALLVQAALQEQASRFKRNVTEFNRMSLNAAGHRMSLKPMKRMTVPKFHQNQF